MPPDPATAPRPRRAREEPRGENKIGTTGRGIGPAYEDKSAAAPPSDLADATALEEVDDIVERKNRLLGLYGAGFARAELLDSASPSLRNLAVHRGDRAAGGGCAPRGTRAVRGGTGDPARPRLRHLSVRHLVLHGGGPAGAGIAPTGERQFGIFKAYCTRVGGGPFPTELTDATGDRSASAAGSSDDDR